MGVLEYFLMFDALFFGKITKNIVKIKLIVPKNAATNKITRLPKPEIKKLINDETKSCARNRHALKREQSIPRPFSLTIKIKFFLFLTRKMGIIKPLFIPSFDLQT